MKGRIVLLIVIFVGFFIIGSLVANFVLLYTGRTDEAGVWQPLFDLVAILIGGVIGWIGGAEYERNRKDDE